MQRKQFLTLVLALAVSLVASAGAQRNELSGLTGRSFISDQGLQGMPIFNNFVHFGNGISAQVNYSRRILDLKLVTLAFEVPFVINPDEDLNSGSNLVPQHYKAYFVTPAARVNLLNDAGVSPWISFGGGYGHFSESSQRVFGGANTGPMGTNTGVLQLGGGLDVKLFRSFRLRGEARDFYSGVPQLNVNTGKSRQHNLVAMGGLVWRF